MPSFELLIDRGLDDGRFVVLNNSTVGVPIGTVFTLLCSRQVRREGEVISEEVIAPEVAVSLELTEVESRQHSMMEVPTGHNAAARLRGNGLDPLRQLLQGRTGCVYVFLSNGRTEA